MSIDTTLMVIRNPELNLNDVSLHLFGFVGRKPSGWSNHDAYESQEKLPSWHHQILMRITRWARRSSEDSAELVMLINAICLIHTLGNSPYRSQLLSTPSLKRFPGSHS